MLQNEEILAGYEKELHIWIMTVMAADTSDRGNSSVSEIEEKEGDSAASSRAVFLALCLSSLLNNPTPYADRMMAEVDSTDAEVEGVKATVSQEDIDGEMSEMMVYWKILL